MHCSLLSLICIEFASFLPVCFTIFCRSEFGSFNRVPGSPYCIISPLSITYAGKRNQNIFEMGFIGVYEYAAELGYDISSMCHMYMTDFAYDGPIFLVPLSLSYPSSPVLTKLATSIRVKISCRKFYLYL